MRLLLAALAFVSAAAAAQPAVLTGTVHDGHGAPLAGASVYLSGTTRGDATDADGRYRIETVPPGAYRLVGSLVGYEAAAEDVRVEPGQDLTTDLMLYRARRSVGFVRVEAPRDRRWQGQLARFTEALLGESSLADSTRLLNPEVLEFREAVGILEATAAKPLVIENRALGYRLTYDLRRLVLTSDEVRYDGDERFEELVAASDAEAARWEAARVRAYRGSLRHLFRALLAGTDEGFTLLLDESATGRTDVFGRRSGMRPVSTRDVLRRDDEGGRLRFGGRLEVRFAEPEDPGYLRSRWFTETRTRPADEQRSTLELRSDGVRLDPQGTPEAPLDVLTRGYLGFERLADLLPANYEPPPGRW